MSVPTVAAMTAWLSASPEGGSAAGAAGSVREDSRYGLRWVSIPAGTGVIGDTNGSSDEKPRWTVRFSKPFEMLETEVTNRQYAAVVTGHGARDDKPVNDINWDEAGAYCSSVGGRLPTEVEWEYAARAGGKGSYGLNTEGAEITEATLPAYAWFKPTKSVQGARSKRPNRWGLYGMFGNVWEWVQDGYSATAWSQLGAGNNVVTDPGFVDKIGNKPPHDRVTRGGGSWDFQDVLRSGIRCPTLAGFEWQRIGFRCVIASSRQPMAVDP